MPTPVLVAWARALEKRATAMAEREAAADASEAAADASEAALDLLEERRSALEVREAALAEQLRGGGRGKEAGKDAEDGRGGASNAGEEAAS